MYAVFGSFTGMYGRGELPFERMRHQVHAAGMLVTGVAIGSLLSVSMAPAVVLVPVVTAFATVGSLVTDRLRLRPGGPFFGIFALGACATVHPEGVSAWLTVAICAGTAAYCIALGLLISVLSAMWFGVPAGSSGAPAMRDHLGVRELRSLARRPDLTAPAFPPGAGAQALRYALATAVAGSVGTLLGVDHANWAMTAAAVPLAVIVSGAGRDIRAVVHRGVHRVVGTLAGLLVTAAILVPQPGPVVLAIIVMVLLFPTELFLSHHHGMALGFFTPLIMLMTVLIEPTDPASLLFARGIDTLIGVAAGIGAAALIPGPPKRPDRA
ncbi:FUSC family protein [Epidermidibacterium keratini]|uniref:FUSC family protein n=2 Tax=Epidermidibacterium keratini TaxID=1891644 RepID=A0A7L4YSY6_9ACTN|nr:FUSC family protein [Epidermidibacterium keratini]